MKKNGIFSNTSANTRLCPHTFVATHVCAQTHFCPDML